MDITEQWQLLAVELGLEFRHEIRPRIELPSMHKMAAKALKKGNLAQAEHLFENPMMKKLLSKVFIGTATGYYRGFECAVFRSTIAAEVATNPAYFVNIVLMLPKDLGMGLDIKSAGLLNKISGLFSGKRIGFPNHPELNAMVSVEAGNKKAAQKLFAQKRLPETLRAMYAFSNRFTIWDESIRYDERGKIIARDRALEIMDLMVETAKELSG